MTRGSWAVDGVPSDRAVLVPVQGIDGRHVFPAQLEVEHLRVREDAFWPGRLRQRDEPTMQRGMNERPEATEGDS